MARSKNPRTAAPTKKHLARAARERLLLRWLWVGTIGVIVLVIGVLGFGYADQNLIQPSQPVALVDGAKITSGDFQKAVKYERLQLIQQYINIQQTIQVFGDDPNASIYYQSTLNQIVSQLNSSATLGETVLDNLIDDLVIRQAAARRGITVSTDEVDAQLQSFFGYYPNGTPTLRPSPTSAPMPTPTPGGQAAVSTAEGGTPVTSAGTASKAAATLEPTATATAGPAPTPTGTPIDEPTPTPYTTQAYKLNMDSFLKQLRQETGLTEADYRAQIESRIYSDKLFAALTDDLPREQDQVHARHILVQDEVSAQALIARLQQGQDFAALAQEFSTDQSNKDRGGDLGWFGLGYMVPEFEKVVFNAPVGLWPEPTQTQFGYHVVEVLAHEMHAVTESQYAKLKLDFFNQWLSDQRSSEKVTKYDLWQERVPTEPALPTAQPG